MGTIKSRGARGVLAGAVLALAALSLPAHAAGEPAPVLTETSLQNGWSRLNSLLAASYDVALVRSKSSVTVKDKNGVAVEGVVVLAVTDKRILTWVPDDPMIETKAPYTVTFSANAVGQDPLIPNTVDTMSFRLDTQAPKAPLAAANPGPMAPGVPPIIGPSDTFRIDGSAKDSGLSGIAKIELHFYNPAETATQARFDEVQSARKTFTTTCAAGICPSSVSFTFADAAAGLKPGFWTVRVSASDLAGNKSPESDAFSFIVARA